MLRPHLAGVPTYALPPGFSYRAWRKDDERIWVKIQRAANPEQEIDGATLVRAYGNAPERLPALCRFVEELGWRHDVRVVSFGHSGDGNLHINIMTDDKNAEEYGRAQEAVKALLEATLRLGGSISGEHGIGITKARFLPMEVGEQGIAIMKGIKRAFDPLQILNPGKLWP